MDNFLNEEHIRNMQTYIDNLSNKITKIILDDTEINTNSDIADKSVRLTLAYLMKYGLFDINGFIELNKGKVN